MSHAEARKAFMKDHNIKAKEVVQIIVVDTTKLERLDADKVDSIVLGIKAAVGESEFEAKSAALVILPTLASENLKDIRGLEGERMRLHKKLTSKGFALTSVHLATSKVDLGNRAARRTTFPAFLCLPEETTPLHGSCATTAKQEEKKKGVPDSESQVNAFLFSEFCVSSSNDLESIPKLLPESCFVVPRDMSHGMPETPRDELRRHWTPTQFAAQELAGAEIPKAVMHSMLKGSRLPANYSLIVFNLAGYDGWLERAVLENRLLGTMPEKTLTVTVCQNTVHSGYLKHIVMENLMQVPLSV
jgi:hypothetical protein